MTHKLVKPPAYLLFRVTGLKWINRAGGPVGGNCFCSDLTGDRGLQREGFRSGGCTLVTSALSLQPAGPL